MACVPSGVEKDGGFAEMRESGMIKLQKSTETLMI